MKDIEDFSRRQTSIMVAAREAYRKYLKDNGWLDEHGKILTDFEYIKKWVNKVERNEVK